MGRWSVITISLMMLLVFSFSALAVEVGEMLPDFSLVDLNEKEVKISDFRGQYVLYNVWATWNTSCHKILRAYQQNLKLFQDAGIKIVAISTDARLADAANFIWNEKITYPVLHSRLTNQQWRVQNIPSVYLVNPEGKVIFTYVGFKDFATLWEKMTAAMPEPPVSKLTYPVLKAGSYRAHAVGIDFSALTMHLTTSFMSLQQYEFKPEADVRFVKEPRYIGRPMYGVIKILDKEYTIVAEDSSNSGFIDFVYVDFNNNLNLTDDGQPLAVRKQGDYSSVRFALKVRLTNNDLVLIMVDCLSYKGKHLYYATTETGYQAVVTTDGKPISVLVIDVNANANFDEISDVILLDLDGNDFYDSYARVQNWIPLGSKLQLGDVTYRFKVNNSGREIVVEEVK